MLHRLAGLQLSPERIPDFVRTVLTTADYQSVGDIPVDAKNDAIVRIPLQILTIGLYGLDHEHLAVADNDLVVVGSPAGTVHGLTCGHQARPEVAALRPYLDVSIFTGCQDRGPIVTPLDGDHRSRVCIDFLLFSPGLRYESNCAIRATHRERIRRLTMHDRIEIDQKST